MATKVKEATGAVERILLPRLNSIDGELKKFDQHEDRFRKYKNRRGGQAEWRRIPGNQE
jgi:hypothetical protein